MFFALKRLRNINKGAATGGESGGAGRGGGGTKAGRGFAANLTHRKLSNYVHPYV